MDPDGTSLLFRAIPAPHKFPSEDKRALKAFAQTLQEHVARGRAFTCLVTNDKELRKLNQTFLGHDYATDVLSFPSAGKSDRLLTRAVQQGMENIGELAISAERAATQAEKFGHSRLDEVRVLMLHGVLHLTGLDHERDRGKMGRAERKWRTEFQLPDTLIARSAKPESKR
ncbi:MAG: rRNA maturation RNase YbeY [Acidobacteriota bacterium]|nr:rRNA maturation RNase YbeY [Acidobacteriota bacterium]